MGVDEGMRRTRLEAQTHIVSEILPGKAQSTKHNREYMERISGRAVFQCVEEPSPMRPSRQKGGEFQIRVQHAFQTGTTRCTQTSTGAQKTQATFQMVWALVMLQLVSVVCV